jgi:hypothetical protein
MLGFLRDKLMKRYLEKEWTQAEWAGFEDALRKMSPDELKRMIMQFAPQMGVGQKINPAQLGMIDEGMKEKMLLEIKKMIKIKK